MKTELCEYFHDLSRIFYDFTDINNKIWSKIGEYVGFTNNKN